MTPTNCLASLSIVLACGGGCFESQCKPTPPPVVVPVEKPVEAPAETLATDATSTPTVAQIPDQAR
jgi:hypothetical protein